MRTQGLILRERTCLRTVLAFVWTIGMCAGKTGVGKSSTVNSILAESAAQVVSMQAPASRAQAFARQAGGFTLTLIDTPGILEGDAVDGQVRTPVDSMLGQASVSLTMCNAMDGVSADPDQHPVARAAGGSHERQLHIACRSMLVSSKWR